jgi:hypothetical protein
MIKLVNLLKESWYGERLFADPDSKTITYPEFANKIKLFDPPEKNTSKEEEILLKIYNYTKSNKNLIDIDSLNKLISLKSKFPNILDPQIEGNVYRGTLIPYSILMSLDFKQDEKNSYVSKTNIPLKEIIGKFKVSRNYWSFSKDILTAIDFAGNIDSYNKNYLKSKKYPGVVSISGDTPNLLFNPDFLNTINPSTGVGFEDEVLLVGDIENIIVNHITVEIYASERSFLKNPEGDSRFPNSIYYEIPRNYPDYMNLLKHITKK